MRRVVSVAASVVAMAAMNGPAFAQTEEKASGQFPVTGFIVIAAVAIVVPLLFLVATQLHPPSQDAEEEELEPIVAGIGQGRAPIPRWLYGMYVLIPAWAIFYLINGSQVRSELAPATPVPTAKPVETKAPPVAGSAKSGPITLIAKDLKFLTTTITVPAGATVTINFRNQDPSTPHNVAVYEDESLGTTFFKGDLITGPAKQTLTFPAPPPGSYYFQCDVHPATMTGTFKVG